MLQGNPFETQLVVKEHTKNVQDGIVQRHSISSVEWRKKAHGWWQSLMAAFRGPRPGLQKLERIDERQHLS